MDFPFDAETVCYAYITARVEGDYGHLNLYVRNFAGLARKYPDNGACIALTTQAGGLTRTEIPKPDPFYAWSLGVQPNTGDLMSADLCERAAKALRKLDKGLDRINELSGSPAQLIEDYIIRVLRVVKAEHVYCERDIPRGYKPGGILADEHFIPASFTRLHDQLRYLKGLIAKRVYPQADAA